MSRSRKKTPIHGWSTAKSDKPGKRQSDRALRTATRTTLSQIFVDLRVAFREWDRLFQTKHEVGNPWTWPKDGKTWAGHRLDSPAVRRALRK